MHELPVTQNILEIALRHANEASASRIRTIDLVIGDLSSIVDDSIVFYWDFIAKDTIAEGAKLIFHRKPIELECNACNNHYIPGKDAYQCPRCSSEQFKIISGKEFYLDSIEVE